MNLVCCVPLLSQEVVYSSISRGGFRDQESRPEERIQNFGDHKKWYVQNTSD